MKYFELVAANFNVTPLVQALAMSPQLWNQHTMRKEGAGTPHRAMDDIWVRYNHWDKMKDPATFNDEHDSVWYPAFFALPPLRPLIFDVMNMFEGERLGGVLITRIPPGSGIDPHVDKGWHVEYYEKFYLSLKSADGANFYCGDEVINPEPGDLYLFDNRLEHWVENKSTEDRITLIICMKRHSWISRQL